MDTALTILLNLAAVAALYGLYAAPRDLWRLIRKEWNRRQYLY